jgi:hypothetical protein
MKLNPDVVPVNLEEALKLLKEGLDTEDIQEITRPRSCASQQHFLFGMVLRNEWSLWDKENVLVKWFERVYSISHADDVSSLILECLWTDLRNEPRRDKEIAKGFINHWKSMKEIDDNGGTMTLRIKKTKDGRYEIEHE